MRGIMIVAKQRCGTNFIRGLLAAAGPVRNLGEVFQPGAKQGTSLYERWVERVQAPHPVLYQDSVEHSVEFLRSLEKPNTAPCVDVKYNSLLRTIGTWYSVAQIPPILAAAIREDYMIIHLERKNRLEHAVSTMVAKESGVYIDRSGEATDQGKVEVPTEAIVTVARQYDREAEAMNIWLGYIRDQHPKASLRNLIYEDLAALEQDELDEAITGILATCDIPKTGQVVARTRKIIKDWRQKVSNADEIEAVYSGRA